MISNRSFVENGPVFAFVKLIVKTKEGEGVGYRVGKGEGMAEGVLLGATVGSALVGKLLG